MNDEDKLGKHERTNSERKLEVSFDGQNWMRREDFLSFPSNMLTIFNDEDDKED